MDRILRCVYEPYSEMQVFYDFSHGVYVSYFTIFRPHIMGEENHNLFCVFFNKFCQISTLLLPLVNSSHRGAVGSGLPDAVRTRADALLFSGKYPGA